MKINSKYIQSIEKYDMFWSSGYRNAVVYVVKLRGRPLMIWAGGAEEIEKKNFGGPSPGTFVFGWTFSP